MKQEPATAHAGHDESLVVRFYGGDVTSEERLRALDLVSGCRECAELFADLTDVASATAALPTPARSRDFRLTPEDAARLRRERPSDQRSWRRGLTRQLGGAFATLGVAGMVVVGALTALAPASTLQTLNLQGDTAGFQRMASAAGASDIARQPELNVTSGASAAPSNPGSAVTKADAASPAPASSASSAEFGSGTLAPTSTASAQGAGLATQSGGESASGGSVDPRLVVLAASAALLLLGLLLLLGPRLRARRVRG
jgi:hypothetical protein